MSEAQGWRDSARSMFASFGDVVINADILGQTGRVYDRTLGKFRGTVEATTVPMVPETKKNKLTNPDKWADGDALFLVGTFDLDKRLKSGLTFSWTDPIDQTTRQMKIVQVAEEDAGVGAIAYVHLRGSSGG